MSYSRVNNSRVNNSSFGSTSNKGGKKPFCKVCFDAKKPQSVYESHFVKDREGKVTCITLLEQECRYCFKAGHTVKFCPAVAANNAAKEKVVYKNRRQQEAEERNRRQEQEKKSKSKMNAAVQALFNDDSEDEEEQQKQQKQAQEEFPALGAPSKLVTTSTANATTAKPSFASALQKNPVQVQKERDLEERARAQAAGFTVLSKNTNGTTKKEEPKMPSSMPASAQPTFCSGNRRPKSWVDTDSEDEDDAEYFAPNITLRRPVSVYQPEENYAEDAW
jgi:hypothetical protein